MGVQNLCTLYRASLDHVMSLASTAKVAYLVHDLCLAQQAERSNAISTGCYPALPKHDSFLMSTTAPVLCNHGSQTAVYRQSETQSYFTHFWVGRPFQPCSPRCRSPCTCPWRFNTYLHTLLSVRSCESCSKGDDVAAIVLQHMPRQRCCCICEVGKVAARQWPLRQAKCQTASATRCPSAAGTAKVHQGEAH